LLPTKRLHQLRSYFFPKSTARIWGSQEKHQEVRVPVSHLLWFSVEPEPNAATARELPDDPKTQHRQYWFAATIRKARFFLEFRQKLIFWPEIAVGCRPLASTGGRCNVVIFLFPRFCLSFNAASFLVISPENDLASAIDSRSCAP
jgi:hypothetical protein